MAKKKSVRRRKVEEESSGKFIFSAIAMLASVALPALSFVWLHANSNSIGKETDTKRKELESKNAVLENLVGQYERNTRKGYILKKVEEFGLGLRDQTSGDVQLVYHFSKNEGMTAGVVAEADSDRVLAGNDR